mgnify:CR=1 FL=1
MKCEFCGQENAEESRFCEKCGAELKKPENPDAGGTVQAAGAAVTKAADEAKKIISKIPKKALIIGAAAVLLLIIIIILVCALQPAKYPTRKADINFLYYEEEGQTEVLINGSALKTKIDGSVDNRQIAMDGASAMALGDDGTLYYINTKEMTVVKEDVEGFILAATGKGALYSDEDGALWLYNCKNEKAEKIVEDAEVEAVVIAPDGASAAYATAEENDDGEEVIEAFLYLKGESSSIGKNIMPKAMSNGGKYIYALNNEDELYVIPKGKEKEKLATDVSSGYILLNAEHTQIGFATQDDRIYISDKGGEKVKLLNSSACFPVSPKNTAAFYDYFSNTITYDVKTFGGNVVTMSDAVYYVDGKFETEKISNIDGSVMITDDGKTVVYKKNGDLYRTAVSKPEDAVKLADDIVSFNMTSDGKKVYYINEDEELWCKNGSSDSVKIADDVYNIVITGKDIALFLVDYNSSSGGTLYSCKNGKDKDKIAEDVTNVISGAKTAYYTVKDGDTSTIFVSKGDAKFSQIAEDASLS